MANRAFTLTLEPVAACNLACAYCYAAKGTSAAPDTALFLTALDQAAHLAARRGFETLDCVWLGGEPLLAGLDFLARLTDPAIVSSHRVRVRHFIQTNGLLLDDEACRLLRARGVHLGLSLDGPRDIHDAFRLTPRGEPTFDRVMAALDRLRRHAVPFGCVAVVTRRTLEREAEIYDFFCSLGCGLRVNPVIPGPDGAPHDAGIRPEAYGASLIRFFDAWNTARPDRINVSPLDNYVLSLAGGGPRECQHLPSCAGGSLGLKPNGDVVRCGRFQDHPLGNLAETDLGTLLDGPDGDRLHSRAASLAGCRSCAFYPHCHGGCPHNAVAFGHGPMTKDPLCAAYKMIFSHMRHTLGL